MSALQDAAFPLAPPRCLSLPLVFLLVSSSLAWSGCDRDAPNRGRQMPRLAPAPATRVPESLHIEVRRSGKRRALIDAAALRGKKADFVADDRHAWRLRSLLGFDDTEALRFAITNRQGVSVSLHDPGKGGKPVAVMMLTRRSEVVMTMVDPQEPFPPYHGWGGRLGRSNTPYPRITEVQRIEVWPLSAKEGKNPQAPSLEVRIQGGETRRWSPKDLQALELHSLRAEQEGEAIEAWSLRDIVHTLISKEARVLALVGEGNRRHVLSAADWRDPRKEPWIRLNREGAWRFQWGSQRALTGQEGLRNVGWIEVADGAAASH